MTTVQIPVPNVVGTRGASATPGTTQSSVARSVDLTGTKGDQIALYVSQDNFATDNTLLGIFTVGDPQQIVETVGLYYQAQRLKGTGSLVCWLGDASSTGGFQPNGGMTTQVVYRQGATTNPSTGVYGDFPSAFAAWIRIPNGTMVVDGTIAQPFVPAGTYAIPAQIFSMTALSLETLNIQDGASFSLQYGSVLCFKDITINNQCTLAVPFLTAAGGYAFLFVDSAVFQSDPAATKPTFSNIGESGYIVYSSNSAEFNGSATAPIFDALNGYESYLYLYSGSTLSSNTLAGSFEVFTDPSVTYSQTQPGATVIWGNGGGTIPTRVAASNTSGQTIPTITPTVITGWTAATNESPLSAGSFNASTGVFTAPLTGWYQVTARITIAPGTGTFKTDIIHNATVVDEDLVVTASTPSQPITMSVAFAFQCAQGDTISIRTSQTSGGSLQLNEGGGACTLSISFGN